MTEVKKVACPQCGATVACTPTSRWRPFCSERCKLIDLGAWASERYRVPVAEDPGEDADIQESDVPPHADWGCSAAVRWFRWPRGAPQRDAVGAVLDRHRQIGSRQSTERVHRQ